MIRSHSRDVLNIVKYALYFVCVIYLLINNSHEVEARYPNLWGGDGVLTRRQLLRSLEKSLMYLARHVGSIDIDAMFGVAVAQGQLLSMDQRCIGVKKCLLITDYLMRHAQNIHLSRNYDVSGLIFSSHVWLNLGKEEKDLRCGQKELLTDIILQGNDNAPNESQSDTCLSELAKHVENRKISAMSLNECHISQECKDNLSGGNSWGYGLLHRILFNILAIKIGCPPVNSNEEMCCKVMDEIKILQENGFPMETRDLFIEDVLVCSLSGYNEFLQKRWIENVLKWQDSAGCWWDFVTTETNHSRSISSDEKYVTSRKRRSTRIFGRHGCSTHMTGICVALLATVVRYEPYYY